MNKLLFFAAAFTLSLSVALAQTPAPEIDTIRNPIRQGDPEPRTLPSYNYLEGFMRIMPDELPAAVIKTLESDKQYDGWRRSAAYANADRSRFIVEIAATEKAKTWQFNADGKPVPIND